MWIYACIQVHMQVPQGHGGVQQPQHQRPVEALARAKVGAALSVLDADSLLRVARIVGR